MRGWVSNYSDISQRKNYLGISTKRKNKTKQHKPNGAYKNLCLRDNFLGKLLLRANIKIINKLWLVLYNCI